MLTFSSQATAPTLLAPTLLTQQLFSPCHELFLCCALLISRIITPSSPNRAAKSKNNNTHFLRSLIHPHTLILLFQQKKFTNNRTHFYSTQIHPCTFLPTHRTYICTYQYKYQSHHNKKSTFPPFTPTIQKSINNSE